jgi:hypothetical protein
MDGWLRLAGAAAIGALAAALVLRPARRTRRRICFVFKGTVTEKRRNKKKKKEEGKKKKKKEEEEEEEET